MSADLGALQAELERLRALLATAPTGADRAALRSAIIELTHRTDAAIASLTAFRTSIREVVDGIKALPAERAVSVRHDHIGASTFVERGWSELAAGDWTAAEALLRQAVSLDATSSAARALLGWALLHLDRTDEALALSQRVLADDPRSALAQVGAGAAQLKRGQLIDAERHLDEAARGGDPRARLYALYWRGMLSIAREAWPDAVEDFRQALALGPNLAEAWAELGRVQWYLGHAAQAREAWSAGARVRHSPHAARCASLLDATGSGSTSPRPSLA